VTDAEGPDSTTVRVDKWLWRARLCKTRSLAAKLVGDGKLRVNGQRVTKPSASVRPGDVLTAAIHGRIRVLRVLGLGVRRGPAPEAEALYDDLSPAPSGAAQELPPAGSGG